MHVHLNVTQTSVCIKTGPAARQRAFCYDVVWWEKLQTAEHHAASLPHALLKGYRVLPRYVQMRCSASKRFCLQINQNFTTTKTILITRMMTIMVTITIYNSDYNIYNHNDNINQNISNSLSLVILTWLVCLVQLFRFLVCCLALLMLVSVVLACLVRVVTDSMQGCEQLQTALGRSVMHGIAFQ